MPVTPTYPGVYVVEIPSGVRTITGVATSVAAFVDYFRRGAVNRAIQIFSIADFEREFGGLDTLSEASYAIQQFFLNGGREAWVVRVTTPAAAPSTVAMSDAINGAATLTLVAANAGTWGDSLRASVDNQGTVTGEFNLVVSEVSTVNGRAAVARQEVFRNLSMSATNPDTTPNSRYVATVINDPLTGSKLVQVQTSPAPGANAPLANGTVSGAHAVAPTIQPAPMFKITVDDGTTATTVDNVAVSIPAGLVLPVAVPLNTLASALQAAIRSAAPANPAFAAATVSVLGDRLLIYAGGTNSRNVVTFDAAGGGSTFATEALLPAADGGVGNMQEYVFGVAAIAGTALAGGTAGNNGAQPGGTDLIGNQVSKTGIYALEDVDLFNILALPRAAMLNATNLAAVTTVAETYCEDRRAFFVMDTPPGIDEVAEVTNWLGGNGTLRHRNAALYYPRVHIPDPLDENRLRSVGASGTVAGVYARTDSDRGVWKAPAGTEAVVRNVPELEDALTDAENGALNPLGINCLRSFPIFGNIVWGARTLEGADQQASEWKYVPVRRTALFLEESLYRGLKWVVFEPNDEPLWSQIRLNVGAFMQNLFRQGAFQGRTPREAYFVKCDSETTTQNDINLGIVNIVVGFAPLKPAEFVILKLQQMAGQIAT